MYEKHSLAVHVVSPTVKAGAETPPSGFSQFHPSIKNSSAVHVSSSCSVYKNKSEHSDIWGPGQSLCCHVSDDDQVHRAGEVLQEGHGVPVIDVNKVITVRLYRDETCELLELILRKYLLYKEIKS